MYTSVKQKNKVHLEKGFLKKKGWVEGNNKNTNTINTKKKAGPVIPLVKALAGHITRLKKQ